VSEGLIVVLYMLLIAAGVLAVSALPTSAARQQRRAVLTHTSAPDTPLPPTPRAGGFATFPPAPLSPLALTRPHRCLLVPLGRGNGVAEGRP